jgi:hypothetical protein
VHAIHIRNEAPVLSLEFIYFVDDMDRPGSINDKVTGAQAFGIITIVFLQIFKTAILTMCTYTMHQAQRSDPTIIIGLSANCS